MLLLLQEEIQGKESRAMAQKLESVQLELGRVQRQRDSHVLRCKSLQHRLATLQDVTLLSHARANPALVVAGAALQSRPSAGPKS